MNVLNFGSLTSCLLEKQDKFLLFYVVDMKDKIIPFRKYYFIFLNGGLIYFGLAFIIVGKAKNSFKFSGIDIILFFILSFIPTVLFLVRFFKGNYFWNLNIYKKLLLVAHIPLSVGFLLTVLKSNYYYLISVFPVFLLNFLVLIPFKKE